MRNFVLGGLTAIASLAGVAHATDLSNALTNSNPGFDAQLNCCNSNPTGITGFTFADTGNDVSGVQQQALVSDPNDTATNGGRSAFLNVADGPGTITTNASTVIIQPNTTYTATVDFGRNGEGGSYGRNGTDTLTLLSGTTAISGATTTTGAAATVASTTPIANGTFQSSGPVTFTTGDASDPLVGTTLNLQLTAAPIDGNGAQSIFDNIILTSIPVTPEPASLSLLSLGALGLLGRRRRA